MSDEDRDILMRIEAKLDGLDAKLDLEARALLEAPVPALPSDLHHHADHHHHHHAHTAL